MSRRLVLLGAALLSTVCTLLLFLIPSAGGPGGRSASQSFSNPAGGPGGSGLREGVLPTSVDETPISRTGDGTDLLPAPGHLSLGRKQELLASNSVEPDRSEEELARLRQSIASGKPVLVDVYHDT